MTTRRCLPVFVLLAFTSSSEGTETKLQLNASMLKMYPDIAKQPTRTSNITTAVDGDDGRGVHNPTDWIKCATSKPTWNKLSPHWLAIDLKGVFSISKVSVSFRYTAGNNAAVFVGNNQSLTNGHDDYQCGARWTQNVQQAPRFHAFLCQPPKWASHVSVQRVDKFIQICEVKVYYSQDTSVGVNVSVPSAPDSPQTVFVGEPVLCTTRLVSSNATDLLHLQWVFPNGTAVSQRSESHANVTQQYNANFVGLSFNSLTALPGGYSCRYTLNGRQRRKTVSISAFDCGWLDWGSCSCGKGTRKRQHRNSVTQRTQSGCISPTQQCFNTTCPKLNLNEIGASAAQGPQNRYATFGKASLAIDGHIRKTTANTLVWKQCTASQSSSRVNAWLRIDLKRAYLISKVIITFYNRAGRNAMIRVGSRISNDGNDNLLCGTVKGYSGSSLASIQRTVQCKEKLWGRYVNVQRPTSGNLEICEVEIYNELLVGILYKKSNVTKVYVNEGHDLSGALMCGVSPDTTGYNDALRLNWKSLNGTYLPFLTDGVNPISQMSNGTRKLYIRNVSVAEEGWYVCEYTAPDTRQMGTVSVEILVNVDCGWSEWRGCSGTCGVGSRSRSADNPTQRNRGRECKGSSAENCTDLPPCPPFILDFTTVRQVDEGDPVELRCEAHIQYVNQTVNFQWVRYGEDGKGMLISGTDSDDRVTTTSFKNTNRSHFFYGTLRLNSVSRVDSGSYACRITGSFGTSSYSPNNVTVNVKFAPENMIPYTVPTVAVKGQAVTFHCTADGNPAPTYTWLRDGMPVSSRSTFSIKNVSFDTAGVYVCVANNTIEAGRRTNSASVALKVEGPPQNCILKSARSHSSSSLTLEVKCFNGNSNITGYLLRFKKTSSSVWGTRNVTVNNNNAEEPVLTDLEANTQYDVQVKAYNRHGYGIGVRNDSFSVIRTVKTAEDGQSSSGAVVGAVIAIVLLVILLIVAVILIRRRRQSHEKKLTHAALREPINLETVKPIVDYATPDELDTPNGTTAVPDSTELVSITAYEGTTALLPSDVIGDQPTILTWSKDEKQLSEEDPRFLVLGDGALLVESVRDSDAGIYACFAGNEMAADEQRVELTVKKQQDALQKPNPWQNPNTPVGPTRQPMRHKNSGRHAIPTDEFADYVAAMHNHNNVGFSDEFKLIDRNEIELTATAFEANKEVNRYKNIPTYDHSRVKLPMLTGISDSDYIATAYVDGYCKPKKYIAAQGPLKRTCIDLWRMIWAEDIPTVVMLTHLQEGIKIKCHQYWPSMDGDNVTFGPFVVTLRKTDVYANYTVRTLSVSLIDQKRTVYQYHFTAWPDHDVPKFATGLLGFIGRVNRDHAQDRGPIAVHCSAGVGRTGTYIVIDTMLDRAEDSQPIDIYSCVTYLRTRRAQMVQTQVQYMFIHDAVLEGVICGNTKIPVHNIHNAVVKMSKKDSKSKMTGFQLHFKVIQASGPHPDNKACRAGLQPSVQMKNRYKDIVPFDRSRVLLKTMEDSTDEYVNTAAGADYINASFVDGYRRRDAFIVTQSPLKATVNDFWNMIWEQNCYSIVMLTPLKEDGKEMCHQYWPTSDITQYGSITVELNEETERGDYVMRDMTVTKGLRTKRIVTQFHYKEWPENGSPHTPSDILDMADQLQKWQQATGDKVITIHCNNGVGRSGAFCGLFTLIEVTKMESVIDFFHKVKAMRTQRPGMVQTVDQYVFMYEAILAYLDSFQTYSNFK